MKRFLLVLVLVMFAGSVFAAELKVTGDAMVRGTVKSQKPKGEDRDTVAYYDYDFNLNAALKANDAATVYLKLTYDKNVYAEGTVADSDPASFLNVERAYINYKFAPFLQLNTGLMAGGQWASTFGDDEINVMRVQLIGALSKDMIFIATVQKNQENGIDFGDKDNNEGDTFYLSSRMQFGGITVLPLFTFITDRAAVQGKRINQYGFTLGVNGDFGMVGLESEFAVATVDSNKVIADDPTLFSAYVNVFAKPVEGIKAGVALAYASSHKDSGISAYYGSDFDFTMVVDDWGWGSEGGLPGMMAGKVYIEAVVMPKLTLDAAFAYGMQTDKKVGKLDAAGPMGAFTEIGAWVKEGTNANDAVTAYIAATGDMSIMTNPALQKKVAMAAATEELAIGYELSFWEIDLGATWAFDDNTSYRIAGGFAAMEADKVKQQDFRLEHKFMVKF